MHSCYSIKNNQSKKFAPKALSFTFIIIYFILRWCVVTCVHTAGQYPGMQYYRSSWQKLSRVIKKTTLTLPVVKITQLLSFVIISICCFEKLTQNLALQCGPLGELFFSQRHPKLYLGQQPVTVTIIVKLCVLNLMLYVWQYRLIWSVLNFISCCASP